MRGRTMIALFALLQIVIGLYQKDKGVKDWNKQFIGDAKHVHFYHDAKNIMKGIFVATNQGTLAMLDPDNGRTKWRQRVLSEHSVGPAIFKDNFALIVTGNEREVQLWDLENGSLIQSYGLVHNETKDKFVDICYIDSKNSKYPSFAILTNHWIMLYKNLKIEKKIEADDRMTFCLCCYDQGYNKISVGYIYRNSHEVNIREYSLSSNASQTVGSFQYFYHDSKLIKTADHLISYKSDPGRTLIIYNLLDREALVEKIPVDLYSGFEPTNVLVASDKDYFYLGSIRRRQFDAGIKLVKSKGSYTFGVSPDEKRIVFTITTSNGTEIFESQNGKPHYLSASLKTELEKRIYGIPEAIYVSPSSSIILIKTKDKSLHLIDGNKKKWTKDEGLSGVTSWKIGEAPRIDNSDIQSQHKNLLQRQISDLVNVFTNSLSSLGKFLTSLKKESTHTHSKEILYGITKYGSLYALNPINGKILWKRTVSGKIIGFHPFSNTEENVIILIVQKTKGTRIIELDPQAGKKVSAKILNAKITKSQLLKLESKEKVVLLFRENTQMYVYPSNNQTKQIVQTILPHITLFKPQKDGISGYKVEPSLWIREIWKVNFLTPNEEIVATESMDQLSAEEYQVAEENDGNIVYKYINPNLLAVATISGKTLTLYLIDQSRGKILEIWKIQNVMGKISLKMHENAILLSYLKGNKDVNGSPLNEIFSIELFSSQIETNVMEILKRPFTGGKKEEMKRSKKLSKPKILGKTYIFPMPLKQVSFSETRHGITNRYFLALTETNGVIAIPGIMISAKRSSSSDKQLENSELPHYDAVLPLRFQSLLTYNLELNGINQIHSLPFDYESSTLVLASGLDLFAIAYAPETEYDRLGLSFKKPYIILALLGLSIVAYICYHFSSRKQLKEEYLLD